MLDPGGTPLGIEAGASASAALKSLLDPQASEDGSSLLAPDTGSLLEIARSLPVPTPAVCLPLLYAAVNGDHAGESFCDRWREQALLELIAKGPPAAARPLLRDLAQSCRDLKSSPIRGAAVANLRSACESLEGAGDLFGDSLRPETDLALCARRAFDTVVARELLAGRNAAIGALELGLARAHPTVMQLDLDAAAAFLGGGDGPAAAAPLAVVEATAAGRSDTAFLELECVAELARGWSLLFDRKPVADIVACARAAASFPRPLLVQEDTLEVVALRAAFLEGYARVATGESATATFAAALARAPIATEHCFFDEAWFGAFGPGFAAEPLRRSGRSEAWLDATLLLCDAIEGESARSGHGLIQESPGDDERERLASWIFLRAAETVLTDRGAPDAALALLRPRIDRLETRRLWQNLELLFEARLLEARCHLYRGDASPAALALEAARAIANSLMTSAGGEYVQRIARHDAPPPPTGRAFARATAPYTSLLTRLRVVRANLRATLLGDDRGAAEDLFEAGRELPWDGDHWLRRALDFARRGNPELARRCLACVEPSPERAYDLACVDALLGQKDAAVALVVEHLDHRTVTLAGRALELAYMRRDPDLAPIRDHPGFPRD